MEPESILNIQPASRAGAHLLIQIAGGPSSGKTLTALRLARGIVGPNGKIGFLDTESGRARFYSDKTQFEVGDLTPPFTPERYLKAITEFVRHGSDILVVDSFSHVWEGVGGVLEMADNAEKNGKKGLLKWLAPKTEYRKLVSFLLSTRLHIIVCSRAKQPVVEQTVNNRKELVTLPWEPIQDKRLKFEMTIYVPMLLNGTYETEPGRLKVPGDLAHLFNGDLLTEETGKLIGAWVAGGEAVDHSIELLRQQAREAANEGVAGFNKWWNLPEIKPRRNALRRDIGNLQSIAIAADQERERQREAGEDADRRSADVTLLDDPFRIAPARGTTDSASGDDRPERSPCPWPERFAALAPQPVDLAGDELDWPGYAAAAVALIGEATPAEASQYRLLDNPHLQLLRRSEASDEFRRIALAMADRAKAAA